MELGILSKFATVQLVAWSANGDGSALTSPITILIDAFMRVIVLSNRTNRARCALYKKILDLPDEESVSGETSGRASL